MNSFERINRIMDWVIGTIIVFIVGMFIYGAATRPYDPTDDADNRERSGLYFYVDHGTGCQYIKGSWFAKLTPRTDPSRRHICGDYFEWDARENE